MSARRLPWIPRLSGLVIRIGAACLARVRVEGLDNLPENGPALFAVNHASNADGMLLMAYVVPALGRRMRWLGKEEALRWPFFGWVMRENGIMGIRRGAGDLEAFRAARQVLDEGGFLTIFPEGTRSPTGSLQEAKEGATVLAMRSGVPIVPIGIAGSHRFWPKGKAPRFGRRMTVRVGRQFRLSPATPGTSRRDAVAAATREIMCHIAELLPPDQRGAYASPVARPGIDLPGTFS